MNKFLNTPTLNSRHIFLSIFFLECLSFIIYFFPAYNLFLFAILSFAIFLASIKNINYAFAFLIIDLVINSFGRLFSFGFLSIRMIIWLSLLLSWLVIELKNKFGKDKNKFIMNNDFKSFSFYTFAVLLICFLWGIVNGFISENSFSNIFFDFNGWLYLFIFFPAYRIYTKLNYDIFNIYVDSFLKIFSSAVLWISLKTLFLLYAFSHKFYFLEDIYRWVRDTRVGEITQIKEGFYRIFIQSHIYVFLALFLFLTIYLYKKSLNLGTSKEFWMLIILSSVNILNFSRSNWVGLFFSFLILIFFAFKIFKLEGIKNLIIIFLKNIFLGLAFILIIVYFPFPKAIGGFNATELIKERATQIENEAGAGSRWSLLPPLLVELKERPFFGKGFGSTVTYISKDPRILENNQDGKFTTFTFEWGWLDIWLKIGLPGIVAYLLILYNLIFSNIKKIILDVNKRNIIYLGIIISLFGTSAINFFSPYFNHPLGIGLLILAIIFSENLNNELPNIKVK